MVEMKECGRVDDRCFREIIIHGGGRKMKVC